jgi:hypothetical protein
MTITSHVDEVKDLTVFKVTGILTFDETMPIVKAFYEEDPTKHVLWDLTETADIQITNEEIDAIISFGPRYQGKRKPGKTAMVAQKDFYFGLSRMFEMQSNIKGAPHEIMVFRNFRTLDPVLFFYSNLQ